MMDIISRTFTSQLLSIHAAMSTLLGNTAEEETTVTESPDVHSLARRSISSVREAIDPRISPVDRPADAVLDEGYFRQLHEHRRIENRIDMGQKNKEKSQEFSNGVIYVRDVV